MGKLPTGGAELCNSAKVLLVQGGAGGVGPAQGAGGVRSSGQEELGYAGGMGQAGTGLEEEEETAPQEAIQVLHHPANRLSQSWIQHHVLYIFDRPCVRACMRACVHACVCLCVRACLPAFVRVCVHLNTGLYWVCVQGGVAEPADRTREINERLLAEVRRRLQEAKSQLPSGAGAGAAAGSPDEADAGTPVDSPLGGRPKVLQGQGSAGTYSSNSSHCIVASIVTALQTC